MHTFILCIAAWLNIIYTIIGTFIDIDFDAKNASRSGKLLESCCGSIRAFFVEPLSMTATWNIYSKCTHILGYNRIYHDILCRWLRVGKHSYVVIPSEASGCFLRKPQIRNIMKILSGLLEHKFIKDRKCVAFFNTIFLPFLSKQSWRIKMFHCSENISEMTEDFAKKKLGAKHEWGVQSSFGGGFFLQALKDFLRVSQTIFQGDTLGGVQL